VGAQRTGHPVGIHSGDLADLWGRGLAEQRSSGPLSWVLAGRGPMLQGLGRLAVLLVNHGLEKPSTSYGFRVQKFQLSLS
jgi:hypothetical protein